MCELFHIYIKKYDDKEGNSKTKKKRIKKRVHRKQRYSSCFERVFQSDISIEERVYRNKRLAASQIFLDSFCCSDLLPQGHDVWETRQEIRVIVITALRAFEYCEVTKCHLDRHKTSLERVFFF